MKTVSSIIGIFCLIGMAIAFLPFLGWLNWVLIPLAIIGLIISSISEVKSGKTMCTVVIIFGILRLILGGGLL
jgi:hypothetical protein